MKFSNERGTAYVCNNKLVGLLADINPPKSIEKCFLSKQTTGFYVNVPMYVDWLLEVTELPQFDVNNTRVLPPNIPSWSSSTENPNSPPSSTSKPNASAKIFNNKSFLLTALLTCALIF